MAEVVPHASNPYADPSKVPARVEVVNRPLRDKVALIIFLIAFLVNFIVGIVIMTGIKDVVANAEAFNTCVAANSAAQGQFDIAAVKEGQAAVTNQLNSAAAGISLDGITNNAGALVGLSFAVLAIAGLWVFLLYKYTKAMVWATLFFNVVLIVAVGVYFLTLPGGTEAGAVYLVFAAIDALILYCLRNNVNMAAGLINLAMQALRDYPSLIVAGILINLLGMAIYIIQLVFIISAMTTFEYSPMTGQQITDALSKENPPAIVLLLPTSSPFSSPDDKFCVPGRSGIATFGMYFMAVLLLWITSTLEAIRMAIAAAVFGVFYYFSPEDPDKPSGIVCMATTWAFTKQLGTHAISGMVLAIIDYLKRLAKSRSGGIAGLIIRLIVLCILSLIEQLSKFLVIMTGLTGLSFWESAKRTMTIMKEAFADGYITSRITIRVLRLSGFVFSLAFAVIAWAAVDATTFQSLWWFVFIILIGIISPIFGIILAIIISSVLSGVFSGSSTGSGAGSNPLSGPLAGLFFGSIAHAVLLFMEQLILDLVDAAFMCFALDTHNNIISPRGEVVHRFMGANFADQLSDEGKAMAGKTPPEEDAVANPVADGVPVAAPAAPGVPGAVQPPPPKA